MAINLGDQANIDKSDLANYPNGQMQDNDGTDNGTPINRVTASDLWMFFDKLMRQAALSYNGDFDNEGNGYQYVDALIALASKSDYVLSLTSVSGVLNLNTRLGILQENEKLLVVAAADYVAETQIKGTDSPVVTKAIIMTQQWKAGDYLLLVNTAGGVKIIQQVNGDNINVIVAANAFLKAANNAATLTGSATNSAVTPASLLYAFQQRLNDATNAAPFVASGSQPGILSIALYNQIANFTNPVKNVGWFSGVDAGGGVVGAFAPVNGDITVAQITAVGGAGDFTVYRVTMANAMASVSSYFVRFHIQSEGTFAPTDISVGSPEFRPVSTTQFDFAILQVAAGGVQNLKIHCEVVQI